MNRNRSEPTPPELLDIEQRLRSERHNASGLELDRLKQRAMAQASRVERVATGPAWKGLFMKRRGLLTTLLATGVLMTGTGATLAVTGVPSALKQGGQSAAAKQYCKDQKNDNRQDEKQMRSEFKKSSSDGGKKLTKSEKQQLAAQRRADRSQEKECKRSNR